MSDITGDSANAGLAECALVEVQLNGRMRSVPAELSVQTLLEYLELKPEMIVVERNHEILDRARYTQVPVVDGDQLELVHFVGGG